MDDWMFFEKPLALRLHTAYTENCALRVLKHCYPEQYSDLVQMDAPDLQLPDKSIGIEVTVAVSPKTAQIDGEFTKYRIGKQDVEEKQRCQQIVECNGGKIDDGVLSYPVVDLKDEQAIFQSAIQNKMKKLTKYRRKGFERVGLFVLYQEMPIPITNIERDWLSCFDAVQQNYDDKYDYIYFCYPYGLLTYDPHIKTYHIDVIGSTMYGEITKKARLFVENKI